MSAVRRACLRRRFFARKRLEAQVRTFLALSTLLLMCATVLHRADADGFQASHLFFMPRYTWEMDQGRGMLYEEAYYERMDLEVLAGEVYGRYTEREQEDRGLLERTAATSPAPTSTTAYRDWLADQREAYTRWFNEHGGEYVDWLKTEATTFDSWLAAQPAEYRSAHAQELTGTGAPAEGDTEPATNADALSPGGHTQGQTVRRAPHAPAPGGTNLPIMSTAAELDAPDYQFEPARLPEQSPLSREDDTPYPPPRPADSL